MGSLDLKHLIQHKESNQLEAKTAKGGFPGSFWESYSAFANTNGGIILLGVREGINGNLEPEDVDAHKLLKDFWNMVNNRQKISANIVTDSMVKIESINGKEILLVNVPRAERTAKPVYVGTDPKTGTFRRNHDGDYHCSLDEMALMFRDASLATQDSKVIEEMDISAFCSETIKRYRNFFRAAHINHLWNNEDDDLFLRKIGALGIGKDGKYHPTAAGLLMFGFEYEITREFPNYFLDYQENRSLGATRWTDRLVSSSGDWSGNVFDFVIESLQRIQQGLKTPFVLKGNQRIDDTPIHKLLREAITNACVHADFYGRQGLVIQKSEDGFRLSNPGTVRISISDAIEGGISDPRNGIMLKIFSLIEFGERAGSGLNEIYHLWERVYHTPISIVETHKNGVDRTTLTLSTGGNDQDIQAMLDLYGGKNETADQEIDQEINEDTVQYIKADQEKQQSDQEQAATDQEQAATDQEQAATDQITDQITAIIQLIKTNPKITRAEIGKRLGLHDSSVKRRLERLISKGYIRRVGSTKAGYWEITL